MNDQPFPLHSPYVPPEFRKLGRFVFGVKNPASPYCDCFVLETPGGDYLWRVQDGHAWTFKRIGRERALEVAALMRATSPEWFVTAKSRVRTALAPAG